MNTDRALVILARSFMVIEIVACLLLGGLLVWMSFALAAKVIVLFAFIVAIVGLVFIVGAVALSVELVREAQMIHFHFSSKMTERLSTSPPSSNPTSPQRPA